MDPRAVALKRALRGQRERERDWDRRRLEGGFGTDVSKLSPQDAYLLGMAQAAAAGLRIQGPGAPFSRSLGYPTYEDVLAIAEARGLTPDPKKVQEIVVALTGPGPGRE